MLWPSKDIPEILGPEFLSLLPAGAPRDYSVEAKMATRDDLTDLARQGFWSGHEKNSSHSKTSSSSRSLFAILPLKKVPALPADAAASSEPGTSGESAADSSSSESDTDSEQESFTSDTHSTGSDDSYSTHSGGARSTHSHSTCSTCGSSDSLEHNSTSAYTESDSSLSSLGSSGSELDWITDAIEVPELQTALKQCRTRSASGPDGISYLLLKHLPERILHTLVKLYNICLSTGYFPRRWKEAHGIMLAKPGKDPTVTTSYRPISLLNTMGKLFERIVARRITEFFNGWQRAYLKGKEASEIVYRLAEEIELSRRAGWSTTAISLDVEKGLP